MRLLRSWGKCGRSGCDKQQRARVKLVKSEKKAQVNSARTKKPSTNQQHEPTEVISGASCLQTRICLIYGRETVNNARANSSDL